MSWFNLNYVFGKSSGNNTSTFIPESSVEGSIVPDFYDGRIMMITRRRSCPIFVLITRNRFCQT
ncbi:hypothetical protein HanXRQr2_Chr17g0806781 [Helianthus annuus]|uniref:Uncharacterized protein n=1 Tax=Helianthus annuus TaxID=4232 RepID=A0A9K3DI21_HELAN|nr:hypothetical protein HanXRQr2_Chr17g0806781 [Helianthus annuus]